MNPRVLVVIPARGGSKGIPRKNVRHLVGKPLISYTIESTKKSSFVNKVVVSTDDHEIALIAKKYGAEVVIRPDNLASDEIPLDPVIYDVVRKTETSGEKFELVVTIQPTSPLLKSETIDNVIEKLLNENLDTVLTAVDDRHLSWTKEEEKYVPKYQERKNRQYLPPEFRETGAVLATRREVINENNRIGQNVGLYVVDKYESVDIDSPMDWWVAEKLLRRKKVIIRVDGYEQIGLGHIFRTLTIAHNIMNHEVLFLMDERHEVGINIVKNQNFKVETFIEDPLPKIKILKPDIVINDILDTTEDYILKLKGLGIRVFNFEDLGSGAEFADGVFNALYPGSVPADNFYTGEQYYCPRNEFLNVQPKKITDEVRNILITFGGTDPNNLTLKTLKSISKSELDFRITIIAGPGYSKKEFLTREVETINKPVEIFYEVKNMADYMKNADVIFSSAGRTMYEIAMIGTPAIIISQNYREMTHLFGHSYNGFVNLGIHFEVDENKILNTLERLINDKGLRKSMNKKMLNHNLRQGLNRVLSIIFNEGEFKNEY